MSNRLTIVRWAAGVGLVASLGMAALYARPSRSTPESPPEGGAPSRPEVKASPPEVGAVDLSSPLVVPDTPLVDQDGKPVRFHSDLVKGQVVAINFIFTTCQGVCPPMGTTFSKLAADLKGRGVRLISVSVDPVNDTPARLAAWGRKYGAGPGWTLVTGAKQDVDGLLRSLGVFSADKANHSPFILLGDDRKGTWRRIHGLSPPEAILAGIEAMTGPSRVGNVEPQSAGHRYFSDVPLVDQHGRTVRLYSDLIRDKVVVIHVFFSACKNTCPVMMATYQKLQDHLGDRLGRDVLLISFTVDPSNDQPEDLNNLATRMDAKPGWLLLTGTKSNLTTALSKLGLAVERREDHSNIFLIGNDRTQLWKKVRGLSPVDQIIASLDEVIADQGDNPANQKAVEDE
jgi:protein SCO1